MCTLFSQLFRVRVVLSRWTFHKKCFFRWGTKKMLYIQNWWTIPLMYTFNIFFRLNSRTINTTFIYLSSKIGFSWHYDSWIFSQNRPCPHPNLNIFNPAIGQQCENLHKQTDLNMIEDCLPDQLIGFALQLLTLCLPEIK